MSTPDIQCAAEPRLRERAGNRFRTISPEAGDAILYAISAIFAFVTILTSSLALYRQWAELAIGPFLFGAASSVILAAVTARRRRSKHAPGSRTRSPRQRREWAGRIGIAVCVFAGATAIPLGLEILWRSNGDPGSHVQPEVPVIERGGQTVAKGKDPYHAVTNVHGKVVYHAPGQSTVNTFLPYLPLMTVFGIPSEKKHDVGLTDARIFFSLVTLLVAAVALWLCPADGRRKMRALQVIAILPTAALPLATGGDDVPVVAFLLLAMVLARRRQPFASGVVLGIVSAMKFTAWPLAALALFAAHNRKGVRRPLVMVLGMLVVAGPIVVPFALQGPWAFFDNVILFPLGLSGVNSPAASPLPGHLIVSAFPFLHRVLPVVVGSVGGLLLGWYLYRRPPQTASQVCMVAGVVMAVITLLAPATRIGYLLYPINFFVWAHLFSDREEVDELGQADGMPRLQLS
jgi:membrane protein implicated in regulation of membrane protease activity